MQGECESCGIVKNGACCNEVIIPYRDHNVCGWCVIKWENREEKAKCSISFDEFKEGKIKKKEQGLNKG